MTPVKLFLAALAVAFIPATSHAEYSQSEYSVALFFAAHVGNMPSIVELVEVNRANVNYLNADRETPMHAAASRGHLRVMQYLKQKRAFLHPRTVQNWTPLHHAVRFGHQHVVRFLLENGSPLYARTRTGQDVFDIAKGTRNTAMLNLLERYKR